MHRCLHFKLIKNHQNLVFYWLIETMIAIWFYCGRKFRIVDASRIKNSWNPGCPANRKLSLSFLQVVSQHPKMSFYNFYSSWYSANLINLELLMLAWTKSFKLIQPFVRLYSLFDYFSNKSNFINLKRIRLIRILDLFLKIPMIDYLWSFICCVTIAKWNDINLVIQAQLNTR